MAATLKHLDYAILQQCMHCGMCLPTCPTYTTTKRERNSPRGRISLMRSVADGELGITKEFADEMSYCLGCLACQTACPAGVNYAELFETARSDIEGSGINRAPARTFWRTLTLEVLFMNPRGLRAAGKAISFHQRSGLEKWTRRLGLTKLLPKDLRRLEPQAPRIAEKFSDDLIREKEEPTGAPRYRVAVLTGCMQDLMLPGVNRDTVDVLLANGCSVHTPAVQPCCGSLHAHNGEREMAQDLARRMLRLLPPEHYDAIISNAGGCGSHLRHYGPLLEDDPDFSAASQAWDGKLRDIHEWLAEIGVRAPIAPPFAEPATVTYHDSCHLAHGQKVVLQPRSILNLIPGLRVKELPEANWCCGSAGVYTITQPEESKRLLDRKVANIRATGATVLATANPGCHLQIVNGLKAEGVTMEVVHPISLLAAAYRAESAHSEKDHLPTGHLGEASRPQTS
jgi:glycolate oxidase iron-sulfur subunit